MFREAAQVRPHGRRLAVGGGGGGSLARAVSCDFPDLGHRYGVFPSRGAVLAAHNGRGLV